MQEAPVGRYEFYSGKAERVHSAHRGRCIAHMFAMHVEEELTSWPESPARKRLWVRSLHLLLHRHHGTTMASTG